MATLRGMALRKWFHVSITKTHNAVFYDVTSFSLIGTDVSEEPAAVIYTKDIKQDTQCTYNVTLRRVRVTIVAMEKQKVLNTMSEWVSEWVSACVHVYSCLSYPACKSHLFCAAYCHRWSDWLYHIFPHCLINGKISRKAITECKMCLAVICNFRLKQFSF